MHIIKKENFQTSIGNFTAYYLEKDLIGLALCEADIEKIDNHFQRRLSYVEYCKISGVSALLQNEIEKYLKGSLFSFSVSIKIIGTPFQEKVLKQILRIPYGDVLSYGDIGKAIACNGFQSIGSAVKANPLPIIIPCHRVVGGKNLGGYSLGRGIDTKKLLLKTEAKFLK